MQRVRTILDIPISKGYINWEKLKQKLHLVLDVVDNKFDKIRDENGKQEIKLEDSVVFHVKVNDKFYSYKLIELRFQDGELWCSGFMLGHGKANIIWDIKTLVRF